MKTKPPYNIWVQHCSTNWTTFGCYQNAKRRVFYKQKKAHLAGAVADAELIDLLLTWCNLTGRSISFKRDPLPKSFIESIPKAILA